MRRVTAIGAILAIGLTACAPGPTPSPTTTPSLAASPTAAPPSASAELSPTPSVAPVPTETPEPSLVLDPPASTDERVISVQLEAAVPSDGDGEIVVIVTSAADSRIDELVLRWPAELSDTLFLAPFEPSDDRIRDGGPPLVQPWTKWVIGPGERGEPAGTISLGWGPLLGGATLTIPILVTRVAPGPVAFDLHVLAGNDLLTLDGGEPARLRVEVP